MQWGIAVFCNDLLLRMANMSKQINWYGSTPTCVSPLVVKFVIQSFLSIAVLHVT